MVNLSVIFYGWDTVKIGISVEIWKDRLFKNFFYVREDSKFVTGEKY